MNRPLPPPDYRGHASLRRTSGKAFTYVMLALIGATTALPFVWMFFTSLHAPIAEAPTLSTLFRPDKWEFAGWQGLDGSSGPKASVVMTGSRQVVAWFGKIGAEPVQVPADSPPAPTPPDATSQPAPLNPAIFQEFSSPK